jgi:hypothetical protein
MTRPENNGRLYLSYFLFKSGSLANDVFHKVPKIVVPHHNCRYKIKTYTTAMLNKDWQYPLVIFCYYDGNNEVGL